MSTVTLQINHNVAWLTLNREQKRNALTQDMWQQLVQYCQQLALNDEVKVLVLTATGDKAFSAGADIEELTDIIKDSERLIANNKVVQQAQLLLQQLKIPTIAAINGICVGGGMGLALACDFRICVEHAKFGITPSKLGLLYSIEDTKRLVNVVGVARAKELLFLGKIISAEQAIAWGLVTECVASNLLDEKVNDLIKQLLAVSRFSMSGIKTTLEYIDNANSNGEYSHNEQAVRALFDLAFTQSDFKEGANAFLEKRAPKFD